MLKWKRSEFGLYADSKDELLRYYVQRDGRKWTLEVVRTVEVSGVRVVKQGTNPVDVDRYNDTARLAKAVAEAYDVEPVHSGPQNRMTRAVERGYNACR